MIDKIANGLKTLAQIGFKNVLILLLICIIGLGTFFTYKKIDSFNYLDVYPVLASRDKYFEEFGLDAIRDDLAVRDLMTETRLTAKASSVILWGYHNGVTVGPFPFKKFSVLDESVSAGTAHIGRDSQDIPLSLYIDLTAALWENKGSYLIVDLETAENSFTNLFYEMKNNGIVYTFYYPITIKGFDPPISLLSINFTQNDFNNILKDNSDEKEKFEWYALEQAKRIERIFNSQYLKSQADEN